MKYERLFRHDASMPNVPNIKSILGLLEPYDPGSFPEDIAVRYGIPKEAVVNLASNESPYPPPKSLIRKVAKELERVNRYPNPSYRRLKTAISEYVGLPPERVAVGNGSSDLIDLSCKITLSPLEKVVLPIPTYALYMLSSMVWEASITYVDTEDSNFTVKAERMMPHLKDARLVFIGSPSNPTGMSVDKEELGEMLKSTDATFLVDEAYSQFSGMTMAELLENHDNLIIIRSMSKYFCLAGLRIGYALSNPTIIQSLEKVRLPFNINNLAGTAAIQALKNIDYFRKLGQKIISERILLKKELETTGLKLFPSDANFLMAKLPEGYDADEFTQKLASQGIIIRSLKNILGLSGQYVRVTVGTRQENRRLTGACKTILSEHVRHP